MKPLKLKTKIQFQCEPTDIDKDLSYDVEFKQKKTVEIKEVKLPSSNKYKRTQDSSTKLF